MAWLLALALALLILAAGYRLVASVTVFEYERALKFVAGKYVSLAGPGTYWYLRHRTRFHRVDTRLIHQAISGQEVLSSDGVAFKARAAVKMP
jgi:regulator of protease activity HflC (stomatin/prohibitin superfamily)